MEGQKFGWHLCTPVATRGRKNIWFPPPDISLKMELCFVLGWLAQFKVGSSLTNSVSPCFFQLSASFGVIQKPHCSRTRSGCTADTVNKLIYCERGWQRACRSGKALQQMSNSFPLWTTEHHEQQPVVSAHTHTHTHERTGAKKSNIELGRCNAYNHMYNGDNVC